MRAAIKAVRVIGVGLIAIFSHEPTAKALTLNVPYQESNYDFSVTASGPGSIGFGPLVDVATHGCPGVGCQSSFWEDSITISMYNQTGILLATSTKSVEDICRKFVAPPAVLHLRSRLLCWRLIRHTSSCPTMLVLAAVGRLIQPP
jgi:hypothetical protein